MKKFVFVVMTSMAIMSGNAVAQENSDNRFIITDAVLNPDAGAITIILDQRTGQSWVLGVDLNKRPLWAPLTFAPKVPENALPPLTQ
ncbi:MAG TPA: hypothetical protein VM144_11250 [Aestuariivirga sp.]|nr:hypothetical protein [Aestuariivirga sp.]